MTEKPFSQSCENNQQPIIALLQRIFAGCHEIVEIGSGTGQHAVHFAPRLPHLRWQTSDLLIHHAGINAWLAEQPAPNLLPPVELNVDQQPWPVTPFKDGIFTANTCHIMAWRSVCNLFAGAKVLLSAGGLLVIYGPFNYGGEFTAPSNARFDLWLKQQAPHMGIRDFEAMDRLANASGMTLREDNPMPANNRLLVWQKL